MVAVRSGGGIVRHAQPLAPLAAARIRPRVQGAQVEILDSVGRCRRTRAATPIAGLSHYRAQHSLSRGTQTSQTQTFATSRRSDQEQQRRMNKTILKGALLSAIMTSFRVGPLFTSSCLAEEILL